MRRDHYARGSVRRTGRQLIILAALVGAGIIVLSLLFLAFGTGE